MALDLECWNCGESLSDIPLPISRHANCPKCFEVLHCCRMCGLFNTTRPQQCDHDRTDPPVIKESSNFCDYFEPAANRYTGGANAKQDSAQAAFDALFGGDTPGDENRIKGEGSAGHSSEPGSKFNDLFKD